VNAIVKEQGNTCLVAGSHADMDFPLAATVWGRMLTQEHFNADELNAFIHAYRGKDGPEAGLCIIQPS
jgi:hypothetical protein